MNVITKLKRWVSVGKANQNIAVYQHFQQYSTQFSKRIEDVQQEQKTVLKSLAFQKKQFLILFDKAQFDSQLKALLPYAVQMKQYGQYIHEGNRMIKACQEILTDIEKFTNEFPDLISNNHNELIKQDNNYQTLVDKLQRYNQLTAQHQKMLYGDEKLIKKDLVNRATALLENPDFLNLTPTEALFQKKQWITNEMLPIFKLVTD